VGDVLTYTITAANAETADVAVKNAIMTDTIPAYLNFSYGSVQIDGVSAPYSYDTNTRVLTVPLGDRAPDATKTITFNAEVNSTAYGKSFTNTATVAGDNHTPQSGTDGGVTVADGNAEGSVGAKTVDRSTAKVGDVLTYTIQLRNSSLATAAWTNVAVIDAIPEYLSFISGSVEKNGRATIDYSYETNSSAERITMYADSIAIGETVTYTFKCRAKDGAQGEYIVNTAVVTSDGREPIQLPDTGVQIEDGVAEPYMTKSVNNIEAKAGDVLTYTITMRNGATATAPWKNVILTDIIPSGLKLVNGSVTLNGYTVLYGIAGQAIEVTVGDILAGGTTVVTFDAIVYDSAEGSTVYNTATAAGKNGTKTATDTGVVVPVPDPIDMEAKIVKGTKTVDKQIVTTGEKVKFTITATNDTEDETWTAVQVYDVLDPSAVTLINDSVYIDGVRYLAGSGKWTFVNDQLVMNVGDIAPGSQAVVEFSVQFKNDAANSTYINFASIQSTSHDPVPVKSPEISVSGGGGNDEHDALTDFHYQIFQGESDDATGQPALIFAPNRNIYLKEICYIGYRIMTDNYVKSIGMGTHAVPDTIKDRETQFFISHGIIPASAFDVAGYNFTIATQAQIYAVLQFAAGKAPTGVSQNGTGYMSRIAIARIVCELLDRDQTPDTNGLPTNPLVDKGSNVLLIDEVSNEHTFTLDSSGEHDTWVTSTYSNY
jgi:uncharacterized repeat protein (TIGR01451 family)/fimbrial isopeptide formation D2 family protein